MRLLLINRLVLFSLRVDTGSLAPWPITAASNSSEGRLQRQNNKDVVLVLDISPARLNQVTRVPMSNVSTWGDLRLHEAALREFFLHEFRLNANGWGLSPTEAGIPDLASEPDQAPLPKFVSVKVVWRNVDLPHMTFSPNLVMANDLNETTTVQLVLEESVPWWQTLLRSIVIGFEHIVPFGLDHILFVLGIYLAANRFRDLLWQVTSFTVAHSITLGLTMSGVLIVDSY